jgi:trans-L-3-hydroxyproline dehydratase
VKEMSFHWTPPKDWKRMAAIDAHTAGEPLRVITGGLPAIPGDTMLAKRRYAQEHLDDLRTALMWEPRGHADMYGCIITEPVTSDGTLGVLFLHNEGFSTMCGHGVIGLVKVVLDTGMIALAGDEPYSHGHARRSRHRFARRENGRVVEWLSTMFPPSFMRWIKRLK